MATTTTQDKNLGKIKNHLESDAKTIRDKTKIDLTKDLNKEGKEYLHELLVRLLYFKDKTLYGTKYNIMPSKEILNTLSQNKIKINHIDALHAICTAITTEGNLIPYQGKKFKELTHDKLFNTTNINHLHLSQKRMKNSYFKERSDYLLLFIKYKKNVYLIDIVRHPHADEWANQRYIEIINTNWPVILENTKFKSVNENDVNKRNRKERYNLKKHDIIYIDKVGKDPYLPQPVSSSGIPLKYIRQADEYLKHIINKK